MSLVSSLRESELKRARVLIRVDVTPTNIHQSLHMLGSVEAQALGAFFISAQPAAHTRVKTWLATLLKTIIS